MPYTTITKPTLGLATKKSLADAIIDNLDYLKSVADSIGGLDGTTIPNGSFESDSDADGTPDAWVKTLFGGGGSFAIADQNAVAGNSFHGRYAAKFTSTGSGGGHLVSADYFPVTPGNPVFLTWAMKGTADVRNIVQVFWYQGDSGKSASTTPSTTIYDEATNNPTDWNVITGYAVPPSDSRWAKLKFIGCDSSDGTSGNTSFDFVSIAGDAKFRRSAKFTTAATHKFIAPITGFVRVKAIGGGGAGGGAGGSGGGGGGEYAEGFAAVTSGTEYTVVVGAGGSGGGAGADSTFAATVVVGKGGTNGATSGGGGAGGAGGTGGTGYFKVAGQAGLAGAGGSGGTGGAAGNGGGGGAGAGNNNGQTPGGGGAQTGSGGPGEVTIEW